MKKTLLDMVQSILSSMDSDSVNTIGETPESLQVAGFLRDSFYNIVSGLNLPNTFTLMQLNPSLDPTKPTLMHKPDNCLNIRWLKYNKISTANPFPNFSEVNFLDLETFLQQMYVLGSDANVLNDIGSYTILTVAGNEIEIFYRNDRAPLYYTTFDDSTILFDSYDNTIDDTLQASKTVVWGEVAQVWQMVDTFVPPLEDKQFDLLENEAKSQAFVEAKQSSNPKAEQRAHKGWVRARREKLGVPYKNNSHEKTSTDFGRRSFPYMSNGLRVYGR